MSAPELTEGACYVIEYPGTDDLWTNSELALWQYGGGWETLSRTCQAPDDETPVTVRCRVRFFELGTGAEIVA